jgi:hypothetical protein
MSYEEKISPYIYIYIYIVAKTATGP